MTGHFDLRFPQNLLQVAHTERTAQQQMHDAKPGAVAQAFVDPDQIHAAFIRSCVYMHKQIYCFDPSFV